MARAAAFNTIDVDTNEQHWHCQKHCYNSPHDWLYKHELLSWLHPLSVSGEQFATAADGRNTFQQVAWCVRRMLIQVRTQHRGRLILYRTRSRRHWGSVSDIASVPSWLAVCCPNHMNCVLFVFSFSRFDDIHLSSSSMHAVICGTYVTHDEAGVWMKSYVSSAYECGVIPWRRAISITSAAYSRNYGPHDAALWYATNNYWFWWWWWIE